MIIPKFYVCDTCGKVAAHELEKDCLECQDEKERGPLEPLDENGQPTELE